MVLQDDYTLKIDYNGHIYFNLRTKNCIPVSAIMHSFFVAKNLTQNENL